MSISDNFDRADSGSLGANWTELEHGFSIASNWATGLNDGANYQWTYYSGSSWGADQSSTVQNDRCSNQWGPVIRAQTGINGYFFLINGTAATGIYRRDSGTYTLIQSISATFANGDTAGLGVVGTTLTAYKNGSSLGTIATNTSGSTITGGAPGIASLSNVANGGPLLNNWVGTGEVGGGATTYTLTGPSSGLVNVASTNFTVTPDAAYTGTITPATSGTGTFSPSSLSWTADASAKTFTYTPTTTAGSPHSISTTSSPGLTDPAPISYTVLSGTVTISTPVAKQGYQQNGSHQADIPITGTYTGSPVHLEADFNGGGFATIVSSPAAGSFSGTLTAQAKGQGTLTVRFSDDHSVTATKATITISDVFLVIGDSVAEGRGTNAQNYSGSGTPVIFRQDNAWASGNDPYDTGTSSGSHWPLLASLLALEIGAPPIFITTATGSTDVAGAANTWAKNNTEYANAIASVTSSAVNGVKAVLAHLGPNAIYNGNGAALSQATYLAALQTLGDNLNADVAGSPPLLVGLCGESQEVIPPDLRTAEDNIRSAIQAAWGTHHCLRGPNLIDQKYENGSNGETGTADKVHPKSDAHLQQVADRWWCALKDGVYSGSVGRGPRPTGTPTLDATKKIVTITYDQALGNAAGAAVAGFRVTDSGTPGTVTSAIVAGGDRVVLLMSSALSAVGNVLVNWGSDDDAMGQTVPTTATVTLPDARTVQLPAEPFLAQPITAEGGGGGLLIGAGMTGGMQRSR